MFTEPQDLVATALKQRPERFIELIDQELAAALPGDATLSVAGRDLVMAPGAKRARPWLVQLFGEVVGAPLDGLIDAGVAVELIHAASLLHDDVLDTAAVRRGRATANALYGPTLAVLSGDWLLARALDRLVARPLLLGPAITTVAEMTQAIAAEVEARGQADFSLPDWSAMAAGKTGSLFGLCGRLAALLAGDSRRADAFALAGAHLGVAFQIADDISDLTGTPGKGRYNDLRTASPSFPVLWAAARSPGLTTDLKSAWKAESQPAIVERLGEAVLALGAVQAATRAADAEIAAARRVLGADADSQSLGLLLGWADALVLGASRGLA